MVATGTMLVLVGAFFLLPGGVLIGRFDADPRRTPAERGLLKVLDRSVDWVEHHSWPLLLAFVALSVFAFAGLFRLTVETDFSKNFRESSPIVKSIRFFEDRLGGVGTWEVNFPAPKETPGETDEETGLTTEFVEQTSEVASQITAVQMPDGTGPTKALSLGDGTAFIPPLVGRTLDQKRATLRLMQPEFEQSLYNPEAGRMRIMLRGASSNQQRPNSTSSTVCRPFHGKRFPKPKRPGCTSCWPTSFRAC